MRVLTRWIVPGVMISLLMLGGCSPPKFVPEDHFQEIDIQERVARKFNLRVDKMRKYLETIHKIDRPVPIVLVRKGETPEFHWDQELPKDSVVIGYLVKEHNKLVAKIEHGNLMTETAELLSEYVQVEVEMYNLMIQYVQLQQDLVKQYRGMWIDAENRRLQAEHEAKVERWEHRLTILGGVLGIVAILAL